jgi:probable rRNA maturation factor
MAKKRGYDFKNGKKIMIDFDNQTDFNLDLQDFEEILNSIKNNSNLEFILTNDETIQEINKEYRQINKATDVLSFPIDDEFNGFIGTVIISIDTALKVANELYHDVHDELKLLFIHGVLHLVGYDHEIDNGEHRKKEEELIKEFNLPNSLIVRNS